MRKIEVFNETHSKWVEIDFESLKDRDIFRIRDNEKRHIDEDGNNIWIAKSSPYLNKDSILTVDTVF